MIPYSSLSLYMQNSNVKIQRNVKILNVHVSYVCVSIFDAWIAYRALHE